MSDHKYQKNLDRQAVLHDFKIRVIDMLENGFVPPEVGIYDEPVRYLKMNHEWFALFAGWLSWMEHVSYWKEAEDETYIGIQEILKFEEGIEAPMVDVDCGDVEDCLETSTTIININNDITNINTTIEDIEDCGCGGNVYPPPLDYDDVDEEGFSKICGAAFYMAAKLIDFLTTSETAATTTSLEDFLLQYLGSFGYTAQVLKLLYTAWNDNEDAELINDIEDSLTELATILFCAALDKDAAKTAISESSTLSEGVKAALINGIDAVADSTWQTWMFVGSETQQEDCSGMCSWLVVWDFDGSYVPVGDEDIIYTGDHWTPSGATYSGASGYTGFADVWNITHELPASCKVRSMQTNVNKNALCTSVQVSVTWRGISGTDAPEQTDEQTCLSNEATTQNWTILPVGVGAQLGSMMVQSDHFFCGGDNFGSQVHWVRMEGTGSRPLE